MRLDVDGTLFDLIAAGQGPNAPKEGELEEPAVWLQTDFSTSFYLTRGGRILVTDAFEPDVRAREATEGETWSALILGARRFPQLLDLLPSRPADALDCGKCQGTRWWTMPARDLNGKEIRIICPDCSGKGWIE
jgi:hypothetical protein